VAIELPEELRQRLVKLREAVDCGGAKVRWSAPGTMHLTLSFLGDVEVEALSEIEAACREAAGGAPGGVEVVVEGLELFPSPKRPRVVAGRIGADGGLMALQSAVEAGLAKARGAGFKVEKRAYRPHVTVGRLRGSRDATGLGRSLAELTGGEDVGGFTAGEIVVFGSELGKGGAVHTPLARIELVGG